jgi:transcription termination/antitermination protein NusA
MKSDFLIAITQLSAEKNLPKEVVLSAVEAALVSAYRKDSFGINQDIIVKINPNNGQVIVWAGKTVVKKVTDPKTEITLTEARKLKPDAAIDEDIVVEATPHDAGRIAAQTAKQVILQRLHEAEHTAIYEEYANKEGDILTGVVHRVEPKQILIDMGRSEAAMPASEQVHNERYRVGQRLKVYMVEVMRTPRGPKVIVSRSHPNLLKRLFEMEVPEVYNGQVEIKAIAREAGYRSKIAVVAKQEGVDPVGCCVGLRGIRIQNVVNELNGEKIDVITWNNNTNTFISNALSPAQVLRVNLNQESEIAEVIVPDRQLSLAIGKEGQNVRLAAKLSGWRIDIKSASVAEEERQAQLASTGETATPETDAAEVAGETAAEVVAETAAVEPEQAPVAAETTIDSDKELAELEKMIAEDEAAKALAEAEAAEEAKEEEEEGELISIDELNPPIPFDLDLGVDAPVVRFAEDIFPVVPGRSSGRGSKKKDRGGGAAKGKARKKQS